MPSLANLMEDYRNWRGRQEWESGKGWQDFFGGDPRAQEQFEKLSGFGTGSHGLGGLAGTFVGTKARTSDLKALDVAKQLEKAGEDPKKIWFDTGWFKAPWDKKWRSEISDAEMKATPADWRSTIAGTNIQDTDLGKTYSHQELYSAYPHLAEAELYANPDISSRARYETGPTGEDMISVKLDRPQATATLKDYFSRLRDPKSPDYWKSVAAEGYFDQDYPTYRAGLKDMLSHAKDVRNEISDMNQGMIYPSKYEERFMSPVIHEVQHAIQDLEGFARGGSPEEFTAGGKINPETGQQYTMEEAADLYQKMGGEAESRLTQKRLKYPAGLRRLIFPLDELDVPLEEIYNPRNHVSLKTK